MLLSFNQQALERLDGLEEGNVSEAFSQMCGRSAYHTCPPAAAAAAGSCCCSLVLLNRL
jgi:hypothetical protein